MVLRSDSGIELLIHIGLDTVNLNGKYFSTTIKNKDRITTGEKLETFNIDKIKKAGYDITTLVIITNAKEFGEIDTKQDSEKIDTGDQLLIVNPEPKIDLEPVKTNV